VEMYAEKKPVRDVPLGSRLAILRRLYRYMLEWRGLYYGMLLLLVLNLACEIAIPLIIESAVNAITYSNGLRVDYAALTVSLGMFAFVVVMNAVMGCAQGRISAKITLNLARRLRRDAFSNLQEISVASFDRMRHGDLMSRIMNDVDLAAGAFTESFTELVSALVVVVGCAVIMFTRCASLAAISVGTGILSVAVMGVLSGLVFPVLSQRQAALGQMNTHVEESLKAFRACKAGGRMNENNRRMEGLSRDYYDRCLRASRLEFVLGPLMLVLGNLNFLLTVSFGASRILSGVITVGTMQAFIMYSRQFMEPLNAMGDYFVQAQSAMAGAERVFRLIDHAGERQEIASARVPGPAQRDGETGLTFEDVQFAYHRNIPVLRGLSLSLKRGERLALVGRTGAGKTTMAQLLLLFYANYQGQIRLDGREIREMDPAELRRRFAVVPQEPRIVEGSLCDNLMYGCEGVERGQVEQAVREIGAEGIIARLPQGLDTPMDGVGDNLSQGQLQMICLIRALLRNASVLILDEATSSMDPETEDSLKRGMDAAMAGRTCIVIAHRLSSVWDADHIAVLSDGVISEYGTHDALMARRGTYYQLYHKQLSGKEI